MTFGLFFNSSMVAHSHSGDNEAFNESESHGPQPVSLDEQGIAAIKIKTEPATRGKLQNSLKATGEVLADETRAFNVTVPIAGVVRKVLVKQGDTVKAGQTMAILHSIEVATILTQLLNDRTKTRADIARIQTQYESDIKVQSKAVELSKIGYEREEALLTEGISARKLYQEAKSSYESNVVKLETLKDRLKQEIILLNKQFAVNTETVKGQLKIMGIPSSTVDTVLKSGIVSANLPIVAPVNGWIVKRDITLGERVEPLKSIFSIIDLSPIWIMVDIYQEQIPLVKEGQSVRIQNPAKEVVTGKISSKSAVIDPVTKTLHVRIISDNNGEILRPGMFVDAEINIGSKNEIGLLVPESAVVTHKNRNYVYDFCADEGHYDPIEVTIGQRSNGMVQINSGIQEGMEIVTSGANQLLAQSITKPDAEKKHAGEKHEDHKEHEEAEKSTDGKTDLITGIAIGLGVSILALLLWILLHRVSKRKEANN